MIYQIGINRPMVMGIQTILGIDVDGFFGPETERTVRLYQELHDLDIDGIIGPITFARMSPNIPVKFKIFELICQMEIGATRNAWAFAGDCGDGYGVNYGPLQINVKGGSVADYTRFYMPKDKVFKDFYGTPEGAKCMLAYFEGIHYRAAIRFCEGKGFDTSPYLIGILCDCQVQGGSIYPSRAPRPETWLYWPIGDEWTAYGQYVKTQYEIDDATFADLYLRCIKQAKEYGIATVSAIAEIHPLSGNPKYLSDQLSRRRLWGQGHSKIHGETVLLKDFGL